MHEKITLERISAKSYMKNVFFNFFFYGLTLSVFLQFINILAKQEILSTFNNKASVKFLLKDCMKPLVVYLWELE